MKRKNIIKEIILQNQNRDLSYLKNRNTEVPINTGKIISITGVRRCGKTHLLLLTIRKLFTNSIGKENIIFINFEDERLNMKAEELDLIIQSYRELYPEKAIKEVHFFFDEIQNLQGWEKFVRRVYDTISQNIYITGSNSKMLSSDIATSLRGRNINIELFPLSFAEYVSFKNIDTNFYKPDNRAVLVNELNNYLSFGGFPEIINSKFSQKILHDYYYVMLYKDLIERYQIRNIPALKYFLSRLIVNIGKPSSIHKIYNELKSAGHKISKDSLYQFSEYAESIYMSFKISKFDYSFIKSEQSGKKIYFIDNGLVNSLTYQFSENYGVLLENAVFLYLRQKWGNSVYFHKNKTECDFVVVDKDKIVDIIQVSYDIEDKETLDREIRGLENAAQYFKINKGTIITFDQEIESFITKKQVQVEIIPAYKYFLEPGYSET